MISSSIKFYILYDYNMKKETHQEFVLFTNLGLHSTCQKLIHFKIHFLFAYVMFLKWIKYPPGPLHS